MSTSSRKYGRQLGAGDVVVEAEAGVGGEDDEQDLGDDETLEEAEGRAADVIGPAEHQERGGLAEHEGDDLAEEIDRADEDEERYRFGCVFVVHKDEDVGGEVIVELTGDDDAENRGDEGHHLRG